jgi:hypothetical protein
MRKRTLVSPSLVALPLFAIAAAASCNGDDTTFAAGGPDAGGHLVDATVPSTDAGSDSAVAAADVDAAPAIVRVPVHAEFLSQRAQVAPMLFAAGEMQTDGEPFAEFFAGRNLNDYDRAYLPTDQYILNNGSTTQEPIPITDLFGFSTAVESYEYSKMYMNQVFQQTTAGISLANGPIVATLPGATSLDRLRVRMQDLLSSAGTDVGGWATLPAPTNNPNNYTGFAGQWPVFAPYTDFDPTDAPGLQVIASCTFQGGYGGLPTLGALTPIYECTYNSLHLPDHTGQVNTVISPRVLGYAAWKESLWAIDFTGRIHDSGNNPVNTVNAQDIPLIGTPNNQVIGTSPPGAAAGTYIGSSPLEGMWGLSMLAGMDNAAEWLLSSLLTSDGVTLTGFPTKLAALQYDYTSPLMWFPGSVYVTESGTVPSCPAGLCTSTTGSPYPAIGGLTLTDGTSYAEDLGALLLGNSLLFGMTDARNAGLGQKVGLLATFDGDPFPADDDTPDGQDVLFDRALGIMRVAFVDLDRMHTERTTGVIMDSATVTGGVATPSTTVTTTTLAHVLLGLEEEILSLNAAVTQYGAPDTTPGADADGILNTVAINPPGIFPTPLFTTNATFVLNTLTQADGSVANGASIVNGQVTVDPSPPTLASQSAAARALIVAFAITGNAAFETQAQAVVRRLNTLFYSPQARMYRGVQAGADDIIMTPEIFGWLQSALRETYKVIYVPGDASLDRTVLADRIARVNKLYLNGWDDLNGNQHVDYPEECLGARMHMAEQLLTGELGRDPEGHATADRDSDCVPELAHAQIASVMASQVHFHSP